MEIISHRGYWKNIDEKNSNIAFQRTFELNIGTETDVRDYNGKIVISHDIPNEKSLMFEQFLSLYKESKCDATLALNVKSDGLQLKLKELLTIYNVSKYFVFDMSIPDTIIYLKHDIKTFSRFSEYEFENPLWLKCDGIWYDSFTEIDLNLTMIIKLIGAGHNICIVSSELHKRDQRKQWDEIKSLNHKISNSNKLLLCTDLPIAAMEFFYG